MAWTKTLLASLLASLAMSTISVAGAFSGNFEISDLYVDSPFQVDANSTANSTVTCKSHSVSVISSLYSVSQRTSPCSSASYLPAFALQLHSTDRQRFCPVIFFDENTPQVEPVSCCATWAAGIPPPAEPVPGTCSNNSIHVSFPSGTYNGVANLYVQISHTYEDDRLVRPQ